MYTHTHIARESDPRFTRTFHRICSPPQIARGWSDGIVYHFLLNPKWALHKVKRYKKPIPGFKEVDKMQLFDKQCNAFFFKLLMQLQRKRRENIGWGHFDP